MKIIVLLPSFHFISGCNARVNSSLPEANQENYAGQKFIAVTVKDDKQLDGCDYVLEMSNGEKLQPLNLADTLKKDQLRIWIRFVVEKGVGTCMVGQMIRIEEVKLRVNK